MCRSGRYFFVDPATTAAVLIGGKSSQSPYFTETRVSTALGIKLETEGGGLDMSRMLVDLWYKNVQDVDIIQSSLELGLREMRFLAVALLLLAEGNSYKFGTTEEQLFERRLHGTPENPTDDVSILQSILNEHFANPFSILA
jgi:hypothetical protein